MKIGYRFCGSCNPVINTAQVLGAIRDREKENEYVHWEQGGYDLLMIVSGCRRGCTALPEFGGRIFRVSGLSVEGTAVKSPEEAVSLAIKRLREL